MDIETKDAGYGCSGTAFDQIDLFTFDEAARALVHWQTGCMVPALANRIFTPGGNAYHDWLEVLNAAVKSESAPLYVAVFEDDASKTYYIQRAYFRDWCDRRQMRPPFLFAEAVSARALRCLDRTHPHFSAELEAAVLAWQYASERADGSKKKPKQLIGDYLAENGWKDGNAMDRICTLANWDKVTGPKTLK